MIPGRFAVALATVLVAFVAAPAANAAAPKRIVALTPFTANTLAGLGVRPVAIGQTVGARNRLSRKLRGVPELPLSHPNGPNVEQLAKLNPDLVFSTQTWRRGHQAMRRLKIRVVESDPVSVAGALSETRRVGRLVGHPIEAAVVAATMARGIATARRGIRRHPRVLAILGVGRTPFAFLANSWGGDVIRRAGGRLLTGGLRANGGFARISNEAVVASDPDVIIAVPHGNPEDVGEIAEYLRSNPAWRSTKAVREGHLYISGDDSLLQPAPDVARTIRAVRSRYLRN